MKTDIQAKRINLAAKLIAFIIATLSFSEIINFILTDRAMSLFPGWHTTLLPPFEVSLFLTLLNGVILLFAYGIYKLTLRILLKIVSK